jgi:hypothetical protein
MQVESGAESEGEERDQDGDAAGEKGSELRIEIAEQHANGKGKDGAGERLPGEGGVEASCCAL